MRIKDDIREQVNLKDENMKNTPLNLIVIVCNEDEVICEYLIEILKRYVACAVYKKLKNNTFKAERGMRVP